MYIQKLSANWRTNQPTKSRSITDGILVFAEVISKIYAINNNIQIVIMMDVVIKF